MYKFNTNQDKNINMHNNHQRVTCFRLHIVQRMYQLRNLHILITKWLIIIIILRFHFFLNQNMDIFEYHKISILDNITLKHLYIHLNMIHILLIYIKSILFGTHIYIDYIHQKDINYHHRILLILQQAYPHILANRFLLINLHNNLFYKHT